MGNKKDAVVRLGTASKETNGSSPSNIPDFVGAPLTQQHE